MSNHTEGNFKTSMACDAVIFSRMISFSVCLSNFKKNQTSMPTNAAVTADTSMTCLKASLLSEIVKLEISEEVKNEKNIKYFIYWIFCISNGKCTGSC